MSDFTYDETMRLGKLHGCIIPSVTEIVREFCSPASGNVGAGLAVHRACELYNRGVLDWKTVDDSIMGEVMGWEKFVEETEFKPKRIEERLFHPYLRFHGRLDVEGTWSLTNERVLADIKKYKPPQETAIQTAGYDLLLPSLKNPRQRIAVELKKSGEYEIHEYNDSNDKDIFLAMLSIKNWRTNNNVRANNITGK